MKKILLCVFIATLIIGCKKNNVEIDFLDESQRNEREVVLVVSSPANNADAPKSRADVDKQWRVTWGANEQLGGWSIDSPAVSFAKFSAINERGATTAEFMGNIAGDNIRLFHPYDISLNDISADGKILLSVENQYVDMNDPLAHLSKTMYMTSPILSINSDNIVPNFKMEHIGAIMNLKLRFFGEFPAKSEIRKIMLSDVKIGGKYNISAPILDIIDFNRGTINVTVLNSSTITNGYDCTIPISILPFDLAADTSLEIKVHYVTAGASYCVSKLITTPVDVHFARGEYHSITATLDVSTAKEIIWEGNGSEKDPYLITDKEDLEKLSKLVDTGVDYKDLYFQMTDNIDLGGVCSDGSYVEENQWGPIGTLNNPFRGHFDGLGHEISGLYIRRPDKAYQGLFGRIDGACIKNISVVGSVSGGSYVGGIIGFIDDNTSFLYNSHNGCNVSGNYAVGGCVGGETKNNWISKYGNCYNTGSISGDENIGGIIGFARGDHIVNCYNIGEVHGNKSIGGIVGDPNLAGLLISSFYSDGCGATGEGVSMSLDDMKSQLFVDILNISATTYNNDKGNKTLCLWTGTDGSTPILGVNREPTSQVSAWQGNGLEESPYLIGSIDDLKALQLYSEFKCVFNGNFFKMTNNIDLGGIDSFGVGIEENQWTPIKLFAGIFDGKGYYITGLYINNYSENKQGLFGTVDGHSAEIKNLVVSGSVWGHDYVGKIAGLCGGEITNCIAMGDTKGDNYVGGLVGRYSGLLTNSSNSGAVNGDINVGGIVGSIYAGRIVNSYNVGNVSGDNNVGGIVGYMENLSGDIHIANCYNIGEMSLGYGDNIDAILGDYKYGFRCYVTRCYYDLACSAGYHGNPMPIEAMKGKDFINTLNENSAYFNADNMITYPEKACGWIKKDNSTPIHDFYVIPR